MPLNRFVHNALRPKPSNNALKTAGKFYTWNILPSVKSLKFNGRIVGTRGAKTRATMEIEKLTIGEAREIASLFTGSQTSHPFEIGASYLIRTLSMIDTGRLVEVHPTELVLEDAAWIADTGRFADAIRKCEFNEVEPFPDGRVIVGRACIVDMVKITKSPRRQK